MSPREIQTGTKDHQRRCDEVQAETWESSPLNHLFGSLAQHKTLSDT